MRAHLIEIAGFRQILILPLTLDSADLPEGNLQAAVTGIAKSLNGVSGWSEITDHLAYLGSASEASAYAEFVYFHPYIQDFLYDAGKSDSRPLALFERRSPGTLSIGVKTDVSALTDNIESLEPDSKLKLG